MGTLHHQPARAVSCSARGFRQDGPEDWHHHRFTSGRRSLKDFQEKQPKPFSKPGIIVTLW